jgi:hypothetical protein
MSFNPIITWKRRYAHTAADLRVRPWFSYRADLESRGRRERLRNTRWGTSDNPLIGPTLTSLGQCCLAAMARLGASF